MYFRCNYHVDTSGLGFSTRVELSECTVENILCGIGHRSPNIRFEFIVFFKFRTFFVSILLEVQKNFLNFFQCLFKREVMIFLKHLRFSSYMKGIEYLQQS